MDQVLGFLGGFYRSTEDFKINAVDDGMKRYRQRLHDECRL
jgi:hypothetical protein